MKTLQANLFLAVFCFLAQLCVCDSELFPLSQSGQLRYSQLNSLNSTGQFSWAQSRRTDIDSGGASAAPSGSRYLYCHFTDFFFSIRNLAAKFGVGLNQGLNKCDLSSYVYASFFVEILIHLRHKCLRTTVVVHNLSVCKSNFDKIL